MAEKIKFLKPQDILILTLILFSEAIYSSSAWFIELLRQGEGAIYEVEFGSEENFGALAKQLLLLTTALAYLRLRNFDFSAWTIKFSVKDVLIGIALFALSAIIMDLYFYVTDFLYYSENVVRPTVFGRFLDEKLVSLILYAALNGVYEELFFIGICLCVEPKNIKKAFLFSLFIRFSFHTYQGLYPALGICVILGFIYFISYFKFGVKNLLPYFISHAIADIFGLGVLQFFK